MAARAEQYAGEGDADQPFHRRAGDVRAGSIGKSAVHSVAGKLRRAGYQAYGSVQFDSRLIDDQGMLLVRLERPLSTEYHLAVNQNTPGVIQIGGLDIPGDSQAQDRPTAETPQNQAACEALGGRWGRVGLAHVSFVTCPPRMRTRCVPIRANARAPASPI